MLKRTSRSIVAVLALALAASPALANGWEHWSIPLDVLLDGLANEEPGFRVRAARSLGIRKEATAVAPLLRLVDDPEEPPAVRVGAVEALGEIGDRQALQRLIKALADDPLGEVRTAATGALARIGGDAALTALLDAYERDRALVVRASVVEALAAFPVDRALAVLERLVRGRDAPNLRLKAIRALGQMRSRAATPALLGALTAAAGDPERSAIVEALASIADPAARESLERLFRETRNPELKVQATVALGAIRDGNTVASLIRLLADELAAVRFFAVEALIEAKDRAAGPALRALYRRTAAAIAALETEAEGEQLNRYLVEETIRLATVRALTISDPGASYEIFADAARARRFSRETAIGLRLNEGAHELRRLALVGLGYVGTEAAARRLAEDGALTDPDFRIRATAVRALGIAGRPESAPAVLAALADDVPEVRWVAATVLGRLQIGHAAGPLVDSLADPHPEVRHQAAVALGYLRARAAAAALQRVAASDSSVTVRAAARASLGLLR